MTPYLLAASVGYLLGSIPFGYLLVRIFRKEDIRTQGSGNIGATNVARSASSGLAVLTLVLDMAKGSAAVLFGLWIGAETFGLGNPAINTCVGIGAISVLLGHMFPVWLKFHGGKGVATALGIVLAMEWRAALASLAVFALIFTFTRFVSLSSMLAAGSFPLFALLFSPVSPIAPGIFAVMIAVPLLVILKHHANIGRLLKGTEPRFHAHPSA